MRNLIILIGGSVILAIISGSDKVTKWMLNENH